MRIVVRQSNPFCTKYVRPGKIPFRFCGDTVLDDLLEQVGCHDELQIVGPHGSGKSTLVSDLVDGLQERGYNVELHVLRDSQRALSRKSGCATSQVIVVDGYEQLSWFSRWKLRKQRKRLAAKLIVTTHRDIGFETLYSTRVSRDLFHELVGKLLGVQTKQTLEAAIEAAYQKHAPNVREMLFELYDSFDASRT